MATWVTVLGRDIVLPLGPYMVGRAPESDVCLVDSSVSRQHAVLTINDERVTIRDLGSSHGVLVNGTSVEGDWELSDGDVVRLGSTEMTVHIEPGEDPGRGQLSTVPPGPVEVSTEVILPPLPGATDTTRTDMKAVSPVTENDASSTLDALYLVGSIADKALARARLDEAREALSPILDEVLELAGGPEPDTTLLESAALYAMRLANLSKEGAWIDYVFSLYGGAGMLLPSRVSYQLLTVLEKVDRIDLDAFRAYHERLRHLGLQPDDAQQKVQTRVSVKFR